MRTLRRALLVLPFLAAGTASAWAQQAGSDAVTLRQVTRQAGAIFAGKVVAIENEQPSAAGTSGVMRVTFLVERGMRGPKAGSTFTIREWAGLWNAGERYRVGERVMLFLYPSSKLGLTSPVGGAMGRFAVTGTGDVLLNGNQNRLLPEKPANPRMAGRATLGEFRRAIRRAQAQEE